jgi:hypothetical protein
VFHAEGLYGSRNTLQSTLGRTEGKDVICVVKVGDRHVWVSEVRNMLTCNVENMHVKVIEGHVEKCRTEGATLPDANHGVHLHADPSANTYRYRGMCVHCLHNGQELSMDTNSAEQFPQNPVGDKIIRGLEVNNKPVQRFSNVLVLVDEMLQQEVLMCGGEPCPETRLCGRS